MFADACEKASAWTRPVTISRRFYDGTTECSIGSFVHVNSEGWIVTAAHILAFFAEYQKHQKELAEYNESVREVSSREGLSKQRREREIGRLQLNPKWVTNLSLWWAGDARRIQSVSMLGHNDLAIGRLEPFDPSEVAEYPVFKNPATLRQGTSLCKLGFPFSRVEVEFDETAGVFRFPPGTLPLPRFPLEGIFTRNVVQNVTVGERQEAAKYIETSTPGLRGQSGGPIFDADGTVWGIQSRTHHLPLGFTPKVLVGGREVEENQFLNVGLGVHPEVVVGLLREKGVAFRMSEE